MLRDGPAAPAISYENSLLELDQFKPSIFRHRPTVTYANSIKSKQQQNLPFLILVIKELYVTGFNIH